MTTSAGRLRVFHAVLIHHLNRNNHCWKWSSTMLDIVGEIIGTSLELFYFVNIVSMACPWACVDPRL